jgi:hypothetical protein
MLVESRFSSWMHVRARTAARNGGDMLLSSCREVSSGARPSPVTSEAMVPPVPISRIFFIMLRPIIPNPAVPAPPGRSAAARMRSRSSSRCIRCQRARSSRRKRPRRESSSGPGPDIPAGGSRPAAPANKTGPPAPGAGRGRSTPVSSVSPVRQNAVRIRRRLRRQRRRSPQMGRGPVTSTERIRYRCRAKGTKRSVTRAGVRPPHPS